MCVCAFSPHGVHERAVEESNINWTEMNVFLDLQNNNARLKLPFEIATVVRVPAAGSYWSFWK